MIEKIELTNFVNQNENEKFANLFTVLNQLVDAVNGILDYAPLEMAMKAEPTPAENVQTDAESRPENVQSDPYAEQRKWIGKVCKFWDNSDEPENCVYDVLCNIFDLHHEDCPFQCGNGEWYEYCEPVKPDDDIIYKGDNNE